MAEGFTVDTEALDAHRQAAETAAATGAQVVDAGNQVTPGGWDNAYGLMFQMFPQATRPVSQAFISFAKDAVHALQTTADAVGDAAKQYENADEEAARALRELEEAIKDVPDVHVGGGSGSVPPDVPSGSGSPPPTGATPRTPGTGTPGELPQPDVEEV